MREAVLKVGTDRERVDFLAIYPWIDEIADRDMAASVLAVLDELWGQSRFATFDKIPTSGKIAYPNLPHTQCVVEMSLAIADAFTRYHGTVVDRDVLIAAAVLQDASKMVEYEPTDDGVRHTEIGKSYTHAFWCAHVALNHGLSAKVVHIILTHSPQAPRFPESLEGKILYYADQLDVIAIHGDRWIKQLMISK
ncbi:hypothetical protein [Bordetella genomosp. 5]|uniref:HD domain-containing protein n=1 Tax=Bordetella genomosp. 5 TaxID=1395608 RepID=A0A261TVD2_9BORD|nr:hypothetical protein [Bordetella genomosp. 5]OZI53648.1 hypothetical protein CAL25_06650 [Bordetella genomosp. 5]